MEQSILKSTKKILGVSDDDPSFDLDIITHINSAFSILTDLGVGPEAGFVIDDDIVEWATYLPDEEDLVKLSKVKTVVWLRVKLLFDPPTVSYLLEATKQQLQEAEWRVNVNRETTEWVDPKPPDVLLVDGGDPTGI
jgi:hypothetical protein